MTTSDIDAFDLTPRTGAAPAWQRVAAAARQEARVTLRNGEHLLLTLVLPLVALVALARTDLLGSGADRVGLASTGVLALALVSTAFTGQAIGTGFDRRHGVLRMLSTTPLGPEGLLLGKCGAVLVVIGVQVLVLGGTGLALGWRPEVVGLVPALLVAALATVVFVAVALLLAGALRAEAVLAVANLVWVLLAAGGGLLVQVDDLPGPLATVVPWLPSGALGEGLRGSLLDGAWPWASLAALAVWSVLGVLAARRWFTWT